VSFFFSAADLFAGLPSVGAKGCAVQQIPIIAALLLHAALHTGEITTASTLK
jgi:hypothetical protein